MKSVSVRGVLLLVSVLSCSARNPVESTMAPATTITVSGLGQKFVSAEPAQLRASFGETSLFDFGFMAGSGAASVGVNGRIGSADISAMTAALTIASGPAAVDVGFLQLNGVADAPSFDGGTIQLAFAANAVSGKIVPSTNDAAWTFSGKMVVTCWVPTSVLGMTQQTGGGTVASDGGAEPLVNDMMFATTQCASLRGIAGK